MLETEAAVVGGGVVGLACAWRLAERGRSVVLFERHDAFGRETSSRNSEVIHAGIYYAPGSAKARLCVSGRRALYPLLAESGVRHRKTGKVIVAVDAGEEQSLHRLLATGRENGVEGLRMLTRAEVERREPAVRAVAGLLSPETGILDAHGWMDALARRAGAAGADLVPGAAVGRLAPDGGGWTVGFRDSGGEGELRARAVINAAGLGAQETMRLAGLDPEAMGLALHPCKGEYFSVGGALRRAVRGLVYPSPEADLRGLGIHTVVDLGGGLKLGPNALYAEADDLRVDPAHAEAFHREASRYLPSLRAEDLAPAMSGIRPKLAGPGEPARDFHIAHEDAAGAPGFVNLCGIESPGLTASPALGEAVASLVDAILA